MNTKYKYKYNGVLEVFTSMRYINLHFTYLLTCCAQKQINWLKYSMNPVVKERSNSNSNYHNIKYAIFVTGTIWIIEEGDDNIGW